MKYNLTDTQKKLLRAIVAEVRAGRLPESFTSLQFIGTGVRFIEIADRGKAIIERIGSDLPISTLDALAEAKLILQRINYSTSQFGDSTTQNEDRRFCTLTQLAYIAVDSGFAESDDTHAPVSTLASPHPPEIAMSLDRLRTKYPDPKKLGFLIMRFTAAKPFAGIVNAIKETAEKHGLAVVRADENEFHADLWGQRAHLLARLRLRHRRL